MIGVAVKVTDAPEHIDVDEAFTDTDGITVLAVIVIGRLAAVEGFAHGSLLVITTVTASPLASVVEVKVDDVCPATLTPFIFH